MIKASIFPTIVNRLFSTTSADDSRERAIKNAHRNTARFLPRNDSSLFDVDFLLNEGIAVVDAYLDGACSRHLAAQKLSQLWHGVEVHKVAPNQRREVADTTMSVDTLLVGITGEMLRM